MPGLNGDYLARCGQGASTKCRQSNASEAECGERARLRENHPEQDFKKLTVTLGKNILDMLGEC